MTEDDEKNAINEYSFSLAEEPVEKKKEEPDNSEEEVGELSMAESILKNK